MNKIKQMKLYVDFVRTHKMSTHNPTRLQLMSFIAFLYQRFKAPGSVLNYLSGAKCWVKIKGGNVNAFDDYLVNLVKKGALKMSTHQKIQALPFNISDIKLIIKVFDLSGPDAYVFKAATLIAYFSVLRQSNLVVSGLAGPSSHVVQQRDVQLVHKQLHITVRSSKTTWKPEDQYVICIPNIPNSTYCPVQAWESYYKIAPKNPKSPAFWTTKGKPLTAQVWLGALRFALIKLKYAHPNAYTLHSLRRGSAQSCIWYGLNEKSVKEAGRWKSAAMYNYIPRKKITAVPAALATIFGRVLLKQPPLVIPEKICPC